MDVGFDGRAMERAVGEAVEREDVQAVFVEPRPEARQLVAFEQFAALAARQPQTNAERRLGREARLERGRVPLQKAKDVRPPLSRMDIGAVGESEETVGAQAHPR